MARPEKSTASKQGPPAVANAGASNKHPAQKRTQPQYSNWYERNRVRLLAESKVMRQVAKVHQLALAAVAKDPLPGGDHHPSDEEVESMLDQCEDLLLYFPPHLRNYAVVALSRPKQADEIWQALFAMAEVDTDATLQPGSAAAVASAAQAGAGAELVQEVIKKMDESAAKKRSRAAPAPGTEEPAGPSKVTRSGRKVQPSKKYGQ